MNNSLHSSIMLLYEMAAQGGKYVEEACSTATVLLSHTPHEVE
jgi:hypothetical protein